MFCWFLPFFFILGILYYSIALRHFKTDYYELFKYFLSFCSNIDIIIFYFYSSTIVFHIGGYLNFKLLIELDLSNQF